MSEQRCGYVALLGRPNVGKSTLLNHLIGQKLAITSRKPETTRHVLLGVDTRDDVQAIYVDTPGLNQPGKGALARYLNRTAQGVVGDVDVAVMVVDRDRFTSADEYVLERLGAARGRLICAVNKIDRLPGPNRILEIVAALDARQVFEAIVPISALRQRNLDALREVIVERLPSGPHLFDAEQITDRDERFLAAEIIREKIMRSVGAELPYEATVLIDGYRLDGDLARIHASIIVEREGQKAIMIGRGGQRLKRIGSEARRAIESLTGKRVALDLWVKVRSGWSADPASLSRHGYR